MNSESRRLLAERDLTELCGSGRGFGVWSAVRAGLGMGEWRGSWSKQVGSAEVEALVSEEVGG